MSPLFYDGVTIFLGIIIEATPFILLGVLVSTLLKFFLTPERLIRLFPKNKFLQLLFSCVIGFIFPVCECGNVPVARQLIIKGLPPYLAITFLLAAPVLNPIVIFATMAAFPHQPEIILFRLGLTVLIAILIGLIFSASRNPEEIIREKIQQLSLQACSHDHHDHETKSWRGVADSLITEFLEMGGVLVIGAFLASFSQIIFSRELIVGIAHGPVSAILAMILLAAVVSICSNVDAFFALAYAPIFSTPALLAFLVFGPMIDLKSLVLFRTVFTKKAIFWITVLAALFVFAATLFLNLNYG